MKNLIMNEVNVKEIELIEKTTGLITKRIKPKLQDPRDRVTASG